VADQKALDDLELLDSGRSPATALPPIPIGVPSQLLERRPDVAASERTMASANAQIGIAYAAYYPALTLNGESGFASSKFSNLFDASNHTWSVGPSVSETIFDVGLRSATVQNVATYNADLAAYRENVLTAFQQVEDALAQVRILSKQSVQQRQAEQSAKQFLKLETSTYQTGIDPYVNVVTAQTTLLTDASPNHCPNRRDDRGRGADYGSWRGLGYLAIAYAEPGEQKRRAGPRRRFSASLHRSQFSSKEGVRIWLAS
jgi:outer membrane protein TolC